MNDLTKRDYSGLKHHAKVQLFRFSTVIITWALMIAAFVYYPEWIRSAMRGSTRAIEAVGDMLPPYWGAQAEIVLRELGGFLWMQITVSILTVRLLLWLIGKALQW